MKNKKIARDTFNLVGAKLRWHLISAALLAYPEGGLAVAAELAAELYAALLAKKGKRRGQDFF